jgi:hypothetical protein
MDSLDLAVLAGFATVALLRTFATACQVARPPVRIRPIFRLAPGGFYFQAFNRAGSLPVAGYDYNSDWTSLYGAFFVKEFREGGASSFLRRFLCSIWKPVSSSRPALRSRRRAQELSRLAVAPTLQHSALSRPYLDGFEHDGTLGAVGMTIRGEPAFGRGSIAPQPCIRWVQGPEP